MTQQNCIQNLNLDELIVYDENVVYEEIISNILDSNDCEECHVKSLHPDDLKFGDIFFSNENNKIYFVCEFCNSTFYEIHNFFQHCIENHGIGLANTFNHVGIKQEMLTDYKNISTKTVFNSSNHDHTYDRFARYKKINEIKIVSEPSIKNESDEICDEIKEEPIDDFSFDRNDTILWDTNISDDSSSNDFEDLLIETKNKYCIHCSTKVDNFKQHMKINHLDKLYHCEIPSCYEFFVTAKKLKEHVDITHRDPEKPFACKNCEYKTNKKGSLDIHFKRIHLNIRNKKCSYCQKTFYDSGELRKHIRVHTGEKPAMCDVCGKGLRTTQDLNKHLLRDHGEPKFKCLVCEKKFHLKETLVKHSFVHSNERPNICHVCGKGFKHVKYLREHMDLHSGEKKYECEICGKKFAQKNNYKGHQKIHKRVKEKK